jgi:hypothetical protein
MRFTCSLTCDSQCHVVERLHGESGSNQALSYQL